jgi:hypothetical protein
MNGTLGSKTTKEWKFRIDDVVARRSSSALEVSVLHSHVISFSVIRNSKFIRILRISYMKSSMFKEVVRYKFRKNVVKNLAGIAERLIETSVLPVPFDKLGSQHACRSYFSRERPSMLSLSGKRNTEAGLARAAGRCYWPLGADQSL